MNVFIVYAHPEPRSFHSLDEYEATGRLKPGTAKRTPVQRAPAKDAADC